MREIKFRAWDHTLRFMVRRIENHWSDTKTLRCFGDYLSMRERFTVMQYTGLKDENGKEIYEGDLLDYGYGRVIQVIWHNQGFAAVFVKTFRDGNLVVTSDYHVISLINLSK